ncbi:uncharacterized protein LOC123910846 isoform X1 [Trifolium pratense]|uniref:uncharacterized protein LOC123910846 isoform X1 n=2 Tax=Trifolium pratense TaxID=57577 RepID=UPI001E69835A|nr:uncharacterized protein LOC123910846 isoform X1 [Trifolium pratense]
MSLEPLDRKSSFRERKRHESSESFGSVARWRGSSNYNRSREFNRGGDYRRVGGHRKQGSWQLFPEESGHRHMISRSCDRRLEEDNYRPSFSRGDGNYGRGNKESRGAFSQREWRGRSSETTNNSLNMSRRQTNASNDRKSVDDMLTYSSHSHSDLANTWEQHNMKDQHDKMGGVNRFVTGQRNDRDSSLGTIDWKPLKWTRPGCSTSRDSGFSRSSGMRSLGGTNSKGSCEWKVGLQQKIATAVESNSGEAATCRASSAPSEEENLRKKPRLNWGEGLAKFERKHVEGPEVTSNNDDPVSPPFSMETNNFLSTGLVDRSPKLSGLSECASPATPSSAARSSSPAGADDKLFGKAANVDSDVGNLSSSPVPGSQNHLQMFSFNLEKVDIDSLISLGSPLVELLPQSDNLNSVDYSLLISTTMDKLLILKADISKVLEVTETEIDLLENELRSLKSESKDRFQCSEAVGSLLIPCTYRHVANVSACGDSNSSLEVKDSVDVKSSASTGDILYDTIISCNEKTAKAACEVFDKLLPEKCCKNENIGASSGSSSHNGTLIKEKFAERRRLARLKERIITLKFKALHHLWKEDMRLLSIRKHRPKSHKKLESELRTTSNSHQKKRSSIPFRFPFPAGNQLKLVPTSEMIKYTSQLLSESKHEIHRSTLKMPALIWDQKDKMYSMFLSSNGLVVDPVAIEKERAMINPWTAEEQEIFLEKFAAYGKDFRKIATFLNHKTTADCVEFYYKNHKSDCFEKIKKKDDDKLGKFFKAKTDLMASGVKCNSGVNASSLDILSEASSVMADDIARDRKMRSGSSLWRGYNNHNKSRGDNIITERPDSFDVLQDERETVAADVLASICGCVLSEATSSCITSSVDPVKGKRVVKKCVKVKPLSKKPPMPEITQNIDHETCSDESCGEMELTDWSDVEKAAFLHAVSLFGKDFAMIAQRVRTRSQYQCKVFFSKTQKRLRLNHMGDRPENVGSQMNDDVDGGRSDADNACVVETGSANGSDSSGTKTGVDQPESDKNMYHDESNPVEASNLSADLYTSEEINRKVDHEDVNMVSNACVIGGESKLRTDDIVGVLNGSDKSGSVREQRAIVMSDGIEIGTNEPIEGGGAVTELVSGTGTMEPCYTNSVAEGRLVSDVSSAQQGNELEGSTICLVDRDEADTDAVIELKGNVRDSSTLVNTSLSSVDVSCPRLSVEAENEPQICLEKPQFSGSSEVPLTDPTTSTLQYTDGAAMQYKKPSSQDLPSCDFQGNQDMIGHDSSSNLGHQLCNPGKSLDHVEAARVLQCYNLQVPSDKEVNVKMSCSSSATELPLLSQKIDLEEPPRNDVKIFGKILTNPSSTPKPNLSAKGNEENGTHLPKLSSSSSSLKLTGHDNTGGKSTILNVDLNDCRVFQNVPVIRSYSDGNKIQPVFSSLPDSAILLAKYPAAFGSYGLEAVSSLQQQVTEMVSSNGIGEPGILAGGSKSVASDPIAAIKTHQTNADQFVGQTGNAIKDGEPVGEEKDLNS